MCGIQIVYIIIRKDVLKWASLIPIKKVKEDSLLNTAFSLFTTKG